MIIVKSFDRPVNIRGRPVATMVVYNARALIVSQNGRRQ